MLNKQDVVSNEGYLEMLNEDQVTDLPVKSAIVDTTIVDQVLDQTSTQEGEQQAESENIESGKQNDDNMIDSVLNTEVKGNDCNLSNKSSVSKSSSSCTAKNMQKLIAENEKNKLKFQASELLPNEINKDWFETDFSHAQVNVNKDNLVVTDKYVIGVNTVGQSLKNPSYDLRAAPPCPKFTVSPWMQSTIEPDFNIKNIMG